MRIAIASLGLVLNIKMYIKCKVQRLAHSKDLMARMVSFHHLDVCALPGMRPFHSLFCSGTFHLVV